MRYVLGVDFDGVIHRYGQGDRGKVIYDIPTPGAKEYLEKYVRAFDVHIVSSRASSIEGQMAIREWMSVKNMPDIPCSDRKPSGELLLTIDDRAFQFRGIFPTVAELLEFKPWWAK